MPEVVDFLHSAAMVFLVWFAVGVAILSGYVFWRFR